MSKHMLSIQMLTMLQDRELLKITLHPLINIGMPRMYIFFYISEHKIWMSIPKTSWRWLCNFWMYTSFPPITFLRLSLRKIIIFLCRSTDCFRFISLNIYKKKRPRQNTNYGNLTRVVWTRYFYFLQAQLILKNFHWFQGISIQFWNQNRAKNFNVELLKKMPLHISNNFEGVRNRGKCLCHSSGHPFLAQVQLLHWFGVLMDIVPNGKACVRTSIFPVDYYYCYYYWL